MIVGVSTPFAHWWCGLFHAEPSCSSSLAAEIRRSLPRPLIPLLLCLYSVAKYSHSSLSVAETVSPSRIDANLTLSAASVSV